MRRTSPSGRVGLSKECVGAYVFLVPDMLSFYVAGQIVEENVGQ